MKSDKELKDEMIVDMVNDIVDVEVCMILSVVAREKIADDLIRHGWRKS